jgi:hypothetical protein
LGGIEYSPCKLLAFSSAKREGFIKAAELNMGKIIPAGREWMILGYIRVSQS